MPERPSKQVWHPFNSSDSTAGMTATLPDGDTFTLTKEVAIRACNPGAELNRLHEQISALMEELTDWIEEHGPNVEIACLTLRSKGFQFLVVQRDKPSDSELEDALTDLDIRVAQSVNFDLIRLSVLALPNASEATIRSFLPPTGSLVYSNARRDGALNLGQP
jgi:hypothetical protein